MFVLICIFLLFHTTGVVAADPVLYFSDIASGPRTNNSDISGGRMPGQDGAIVTIWGVNLGSARGDSKVYCNGAEAAYYHSWADATSPAEAKALLSR